MMYLNQCPPLCLIAAKFKACIETNRNPQLEHLGPIQLFGLVATYRIFSPQGQIDVVIHPKPQLFVQMVHIWPHKL